MFVQRLDISKHNLAALMLFTSKVGGLAEQYRLYRTSTNHANENPHTRTARQLWGRGPRWGAPRKPAGQTQFRSPVLGQTSNLRHRNVLKN